MRTLIGVILILTIFACKSDPSSKYPNLDLLQYGFPIEIKAPAGAEVKKGDLGILQDVTIKGDDNYNVQIFGSEATTLDVATVKNGLLNEIKAGKYFSKVLEEYDQGFIFEKKVDSLVNYDFRYIKIQGDKEYQFQTALFGRFSEEDVRTMYKSVQ